MSDFLGLPDPDAFRRHEAREAEARKLGRDIATIIVGAVSIFQDVIAEDKRKTAARQKAQQEAVA